MNESGRHTPCGRSGYFSFSDYARGRFGCKVYRVGLHAGFTCPNRDGTLGEGGCTYCVNESFSADAASPPRAIRDQMIEGMPRVRPVSYTHLTLPTN